MEHDFAWHDLPHPEPDLAHGVLELHERLTCPGPALELHLISTEPFGASAAWWATESGEVIGFVGVGEA